MRTKQAGNQARCDSLQHGADFLCSMQSVVYCAANHTATIYSNMLYNKPAKRVERRKKKGSEI